MYIDETGFVVMCILDTIFSLLLLFLIKNNTSHIYDKIKDIYEDILENKETQKRQEDFKEFIKMYEYKNKDDKTNN